MFADGTHVRGLTRLLAITALFWAAFVGVSQAATEVGDAGELPATAQDLGADTALGTISGTLDGLSDRDVYRMCLAGGGGFSASTIGGTDVDTQLFLLDADGHGVYANDDAPGVLGQSELPANDPLTPTAAGVYYLAVSRYNQDPTSGQGDPLFPDVVSTVGPSSSDPIESWTSGREGSFGPYIVTLTGVVPCAVPDEAAPTIDLRAPADGATFTVGEKVAADYACADEDGGSGLATCVGDVPNGDAVDTAAAGPHTFTVTATDVAGNTAVETVNYDVDADAGFPFDGFLSPLDNPPAVNRVKAGSVVIVRFRLGGNQGDDVLARRFPRSADVSCRTFADADPADAEPTDSAWSWWQRRWDDGLHYEPWTRTYVYFWQTDRRWAGDCRQLIVKLSDGSIHRANVEFPGRRWDSDWHSARDDRDRDRGRDRGRSRRR